MDTFGEVKFGEVLKTPTMILYHFAFKRILSFNLLFQPTAKFGKC